MVSRTRDAATRRINVTFISHGCIRQLFLGRWHRVFKHALNVAV
jgi:hypothetical protein